MLLKQASPCYGCETNIQINGITFEDNIQTIYVLYSHVVDFGQKESHGGGESFYENRYCSGSPLQTFPVDTKHCAYQHP